MKTSMQWFATQVNRDFETGHYGDGTRLYCKDFDEEYNIVTGYSFDGTILKVKDHNGHIIELNNEPDNVYFQNTLYRQWKNWDDSYGESQGDDRTDYEPWAYNSIISLAVELGVYELSGDEDDEFRMFYGKQH